jgi:type VI secretion system secreted protein Hcp
MAFGAYLTLTAQRQGAIRGSVTQRGREGKILVVSTRHEIVCPRNPQSGIPTGKRMHKPFIITKELDRSTPLLFVVHCTNENIVEARLDYWTSTPTGQEKQHFTVRMLNANISSIAFKMANIRNPKLQRLTEYEEVAFTYEKIEWTWNDGGLTAIDDWENAR